MASTTGAFISLTSLSVASLVVSGFRRTPISLLYRKQQEPGPLRGAEVVIADEQQRCATIGQSRAEGHTLEVVQIWRQLWAETLHLREIEDQRFGQRRDLRVALDRVTR